MKPRVFIGHSSESSAISDALQHNLRGVAYPRPWGKVFTRPSKIIINEIIEISNNVEFGVFIFTADDEAKIRGQEYEITRDNVLFEFGLFVGKLGLDSCFIVKPDRDIKLPSDFLGLTVLEYEEEDANDNANSALSYPASTIIDILKDYKLEPSFDPFNKYASMDSLHNSFIQNPWN